MVLRQQPERARPAPAVRRHQGLGHRPRGRPLELRGVHRAEERVRVAAAPSHPALGSRSSVAGRTTMGKLALAAKITHVPSMYLSELPGKHQGCRQAAIDGHVEIGRRCRRSAWTRSSCSTCTGWSMPATTSTARRRFKGVYTQQRAAALHQEHAVRVPGQPAARAPDRGDRDGARRPHARARRHHARPRVRHAGADALHERTDQPLQGRVGGRLVQLAQARGQRAASARRCRRAIEERYDGTVAMLASGSLSHRFNDNGSPEESIHEISDEFYRQVDLRVVDLWRGATGKDLLRRCCRCTTEACQGEGDMHDTAMLLGALGWDAYDRAGRDRHRLLRQLRDRADQRDLPGDAASALTRCRI